MRSAPRPDTSTLSGGFRPRERLANLAALGDLGPYALCRPRSLSKVC